MNKIKRIEQPSLKLVGFKPRTYLKDYFNIKSSYFIYPDDEVFN